MAEKNDIGQFFRLYYRSLCLYAIHFIGDTASVEDIVQDAFIALWRKMQEGIVPSSPKSYLYTSVKNACIDYIRHNSTHPSVTLSCEFMGMIPDEDAMERSFDEAELWKAIDALPSKRRQIFLLHKREGLSHKEIAKRLGLSEGTVRNQISRALKKIRHKTNKIILLFFF